MLAIAGQTAGPNWLTFFEEFIFEMDFFIIRFL